MRGDTSKIKEQLQSTEDDNFGEESIRINILLPDRKTYSRHFVLSQKVSLIGS